MTSIRTEPVTGPSGWRREDVEDPAAGSRRHRLRLWITVHDGRAHPTFTSTHRWGRQPAATVAG